MGSAIERLWPSLPLSDWEDTYLTLHRWTQIVGKIRMTRTPPQNHWWHTALYVNERGLTTQAIPVGDRLLSLTLDFVAHRFIASSSDGRIVQFALRPMAVADFYHQVIDALDQLDAATPIWPVPVEVVDRTPFDEDRAHASYDPEAVSRLHRILMSVDRIFREYAGQFVGKSSPVHFFWGAFDLAVTRFSGRLNPRCPTDPVNSRAYSHEVISHGFWPGGDWPTGRVEEPIFYAYAVPEPAGLRNADVRPARYEERLGEFVLPYEEMRRSTDPAALLREFMQRTYLAAATRAGWPIEDLDHAAINSRLQEPLHKRTVQETFDEHLALADAHRYDEDIERNYSEDCVVVMKDGVYRGREGVRSLAQRLERELPGARYRYLSRRVVGDLAYLEWTGESSGGNYVDDGADTFLIRDGRVQAQTIHYTVRHT